MSEWRRHDRLLQLRAEVGHRAVVGVEHEQAVVVVERREVEPVEHLIHLERHAEHRGAARRERRRGLDAHRQVHQIVDRERMRAIGERDGAVDLPRVIDELTVGVKHDLRVDAARRVGEHRRGRRLTAAPLQCERAVRDVRAGVADDAQAVEPKHHARDRDVAGHLPGQSGDAVHGIVSPLVPIAGPSAGGGSTASWPHATKPIAIVKRTTACMQAHRAMAGPPTTMSIFVNSSDRSVHETCSVCTIRTTHGNELLTLDAGTAFGGPTAPHAFLVVHIEGEGSRVVDFSDGVDVTFGRSRGAAVHVDSEKVSRMHARIRRTGELLELEDLGSRNGTRVDGEKIVGMRRLSSGDEITVGPILAIVNVTSGLGRPSAVADPTQGETRLGRRSRPRDALSPPALARPVRIASDPAIDAIARSLRPMDLLAEDAGDDYLVILPELARTEGQASIDRMLDFRAPPARRHPPRPCCAPRTAPRSRR